jgi:son of sevenless
VNTQTGQHSRDLPNDTEGDLSDVDFRAQRVRPDTTVDPYGRTNGARNDRAAGFGLPRRTGTPEPWVRRLADDGLSYFYQNRLDGTVQWTTPGVNSTPTANGHTGAQSQNDLPITIDHSLQSLQRPDSTYVRLGHSDGITNNGNVYSDDSDVDPLDRLAGFSRRQQSSGMVRGSDSQSLPQPVSSESSTQLRPELLADLDPQLTSAEKLAQTLQHSLSPPPPESITALSTIARQSVAAIVTAVQSHDPSSRPSSQTLLEDRISESVIAIRHLLYISSPPYGHVPSHLYHRDGPSSGPSIPQPLQAQLKPAQRRVTATLSKLVLAALAAQYDTRSLTSEVSERMETDAAELDRALVTFVTELQRIHSQMPHAPSRRLFATLSPANVGLGLMGAGAAGCWKGFGWVPIDPQHQPKRDLSSDVLAELKVEIAELEEKLVDLHSAVFGSTGGPLQLTRITLYESMYLAAPEVHTLGQSAVAWLHSALSFFADINLARTVDVDGINREGHTGDAYLQSVHKARTLVRTVEAHLQSLNDDGGSLLLAITTPASQRTSSTNTLSERIRSLVASLKNNVVQAFQTLEALLAVGQEQAAKGPSDYRGSIEWRMSRILNVDSNLGRTLQELASEDDSYEEGEDLVDMEHALGRRPVALRPSASSSSAALYSNPSQTSESSLEPPHAHAENATPLPSNPTNNTATSSSPSIPGSDYVLGPLDDEGDDAIIRVVHHLTTAWVS